MSRLQEDNTPLYGAFIQLKGRPCVVVGGGPVAERKITGLLECGAHVTVIAPDVTNLIRETAESGTITWERRAYRSGDAAAAFLVIAATGSKDVNRHVEREAETNGRLVNVVNDQDAGNLIVPAMVRRGRLNIAVSTSGASPLIAKRLRQELEMAFGDEYAAYLDLLAAVRQRLLLEVCDEPRRTAIFREIADAPLLSLLRAGRQEAAERVIADIIGGNTK
jgi:precorrin-2 dehydrogenase / sirohydrochlorin ferrochelatase